MVARLHHERIARSDTIPARWLIMTHGIFGTGGNWRGIARKINERRPEWGIALVDLRLHGRSEAGEPPHTIAACAADMHALIAELRGELDVAAIAGHSFGGKVALATRPHAGLAQTWILDASPSARSEADVRALVDNDPKSTLRVLALMERLPTTWAKRDDFVAAITAEGHDIGLAQWLAMNLVADGDRFVLRLDLIAMRALITDYSAQDLWPALLAPGDGNDDGDVELVVAERSAVVSSSDRARLASAPPHVHVHQISAGHWVHIDAPAAVVELFVTRLPH